MDWRGLESSQCDPGRPIRCLCSEWAGGEMWVAWRRVEGVGMEKVDLFYKRLGDTIDKLGVGKQRAKENHRGFPGFEFE